MSAQEKLDGASLVPARRCEVAQAASANSLISRGIADLAKTQSVSLAVDVRKELTLEQRRTKLQLLQEKVSRCVRCSELASSRTKTVFATGPIPVELCFIGEAPGESEDAQGKPFVGPAGQMLNNIITACGFRREEVFACNVVK